MSTKFFLLMAAVNAFMFICTVGAKNRPTAWGRENGVQLQRTTGALVAIGLVGAVVTWLV